MVVGITTCFFAVLGFAFSASKGVLGRNAGGFFGMVLGGLLVGGGIDYVFGVGGGTGLLMGFVLGTAALFNPDDLESADVGRKGASQPTKSGYPSTSQVSSADTEPSSEESVSEASSSDESASEPKGETAEEYAGGLERDTSAQFLVPDSEEATVRFSCSEFRTLTSSPLARLVGFPVSNKELFFSYDRLQEHIPIQVAVYGGVEWWWFRGSVYKVGFPEGRASADLAAATVASDWKISLSLVPVSEQGYSADEVAEGVFEMEGKVETGLQYADRMDTVHDTVVQIEEILKQDHLVGKDDTPADYGLQKDGSAKVFTRENASTTQVVIQSDAHGSSHVLANDPTVFELASQLQNHHPILLDAGVGKGRYWKSEVVVEWWWFENDIYVARREKGQSSEALAALRHNVDSMDVHGKAESWIPKYTVGGEVNDRYEEGCAPEEIARLVFASQGREESLEAMFDRIQAAKTMIGQNPKLREPWDETHAAFNRGELAEYLEERKGFVDEATGGHWHEYKRWARKRSEAHLYRVGDDFDDEDRMPVREHIPKSVKQYVWQRDQGRCVECGSKEKLEYDHIIPLSKGGSNTDRNLQLLCERCNRSKSSSIA